jgi:hypothetical protein
VLFLIGPFTAAEDSTFKTEIFPFLDNYCIECHDDERARKKLSVEQIGPPNPSVMKMLAPKPYFWSRGYTISVSPRS